LRKADGGTMDDIDTITDKLFGLDSYKDLFASVTRAFTVGACWGITYLYIRRGLNPDTRPTFINKYWNDALYGSFALFCSIFLKFAFKVQAWRLARIAFTLFPPTTSTDMDYAQHAQGVCMVDHLLFYPDALTITQSECLSFPTWSEEYSA